MMETINPYRELVASISPTEFEKLCLEILKGYAEVEHLSDFSIQHNVCIPADDGTYQIDVYARFIAMGVEFKVITECKRYSAPVTREKVAVLNDKVRSLGAHKGIMISTCGFQSGAYEYAKKHGIALLQIIDRNVMHIMNAAKPETEEQKRELRLMLDWFSRMPKYYVKEYATMDFPDRAIYPTPQMMDAIRHQFILAHPGLISE
ncbi:MAG: restriction endonuclease [Oscillospiraceae bacterium]|nr:restriction endonuclease [Oscillospiraceae bacterium]